MGGDGLLLALVSAGEINVAENQFHFLCFRYPESALPTRWKNQPNGRRTFSNIFIVFAFVVSFLGFLQPVRKDLPNTETTKNLNVCRLSMPFV
jgi:hypothetical protein